MSISLPIDMFITLKKFKNKRREYNKIKMYGTFNYSNEQSFKFCSYILRHW